MNPASLCCSTLAHVKAMLYCTRATLEQGGASEFGAHAPDNIFTLRGLYPALLFVGFTLAITCLPG